MCWERSWVSREHEEGEESASALCGLSVGAGGGRGLKSALLILAVLSHCSRGQLFATPGAVACQAPLSMRFPRQESWSGLPFHSPGDLPNPEAETSSALVGGFLTAEPKHNHYKDVNYRNLRLNK